jgi:hypothetical protein
VKKIERAGQLLPREYPKVNVSFSDSKLRLRLFHRQMPKANIHFLPDLAEKVFRKCDWLAFSDVCCVIWE